jgi:hypothetical protein
MEELPNTPSESGEDITPPKDKETKPVNASASADEEGNKENEEGNTKTEEQKASGKANQSDTPEESSKRPSDPPSDPPSEHPPELSTELPAEHPPEPSTEVPSDPASKLPPEIPPEHPSELPSELTSEVTSEVMPEQVTAMLAEHPSLAEQHSLAEQPSIDISEHPAEFAGELAPVSVPESVPHSAAAPVPVVELERVPIEAALGAGWQNLKSHFLLLIAVSTLAGIVIVLPAIVYAVIRDLVQRNFFLMTCLGLCIATVPQLYHMGRIKVSLRFLRHEEFTSDDFTNVAPRILHYLLMLLCRTLLTWLGYCLFIIPGIIVQTRLEYSEFFVIDKQQNAFKALASSWRITKNSTMMLILFAATRLFVEVLGTLALVVGMVPARWMTLIAQAFVYERLCQLSASGETGAVVHSQSNADATV